MWAWVLQGLEGQTKDESVSGVDLGPRWGLEDVRKLLEHLLVILKVWPLDQQHWHHLRAC